MSIDNLQLAFYTILPLALVAIIIFLYNLIKKNSEKKSEGFAIDSLIAKEKQSQEAALPQQEPNESANRFWQLEAQKEQSRHKMFTVFIDENKVGKVRQNPKVHNFKNRNYKMKQVSRLVKKTPDINENLSKIKDLHKELPLSRLRKISKNPKEEYLGLLMKKEENTKKDSLKQLDSISDKRAKIMGKLRELHH